MSGNRLQQDTLFMAIATLMAQRGTCTRAKVGAVLTAQNRIISTGYVGSAPGEAHCIDVGCQMENGHCVRTIHAEANAIAYAARSGVRLDGATLYSTMCPCRACARLALSAGVRRIVFGDEYGDDLQSGMEYTPFTSNPWQHPFIGYSEAVTGGCQLCGQSYHVH